MTLSMRRMKRPSRTWLTRCCQAPVQGVSIPSTNFVDCKPG